MEIKKIDNETLEETTTREIKKDKLMKRKARLQRKLDSIDDKLKLFD